MAQKILYLVSEDWYFVSHRLPMARAALGAGFEVHVATRVAGHAAAIEREGFILHPLGWRRGSFDPLRLLSAVREVRRLYRRVRPELVHHVALMPAVIGSLAALGLPIVCLNAMAGLGYAFTTRTPKAMLLRATIEPVLRRMFGRARAFVLVQNPDDRAAIQSLGVSGDKITLIAGSGVDIDALTPLPEPPPPVVAGFVGRLLTDKGVPTLVEAHALIARRGRPVALLIAGEPDPTNLASIPQATIAEWKRRPGLTLLGQVDDIGAFWARAHIAVLPSLREGLADEPAGSRRLRAPDRRHRRSRLPRDRARRRQRLVSAAEAMPPRLPTLSTGSPAMPKCAAASAPPAAALWKMSSRICASGRKSSRSIGGCCRKVIVPARYCGHRDLPDKQGPNQQRKPRGACA